MAALAQGTRFRPGGQICGFGYLSTTVDELVREADLVVFGEVVAHDGSFLAPEPFQYTTYYLRVTGYLKDRSGARRSYLKVLGRGGFLGGQPDAAEQRPEEPEWPPYLETGKRYLLYLTPNHGIEGGGQGTSSHPIGRRDECWVCGMGRNGLWWEKAGNLVGSVEPEYHYSLPGRREPFPLAEALRRVQEAVQRERLRLPSLPSPLREQYEEALRRASRSG